MTNELFVSSSIHVYAQRLDHELQIKASAPAEPFVALDWNSIDCLSVARFLL